LRVRISLKFIVGYVGLALWPDPAA
jgi:hypothetical protein